MAETSIGTSISIKTLLREKANINDLEYFAWRGSLCGEYIR
jgi:hypothetical protein